MEFDVHGRPILTLEEKLAGLKKCINDGSTEDAVGHICDLLALVAPGYKLEYDQVSFNDANAIVNHYGNPPCPISLDEFDVSISADGMASVICDVSGSGIRFVCGSAEADSDIAKEKLKKIIAQGIEFLFNAYELPIEFQLRDFPNIEDR